MSALCTYVTLLILAALPFDQTPVALLKVPNYFANRLLEKILILPGLKLFYRPYREPTKVRSWCVQIKGMTGDHVEPLYETSESCGQYHFWHINEDIYETIYYRLVEDAALERMNYQRPGVRDLFAAEVPPAPRELAIYQALGDLYCHSNLIARPGGGQNLKFLEFGWTAKMIDYANGKESTLNNLLVKWECATHKLVSVQWVRHINLTNMDAYQHDQPW